MDEARYSVLWIIISPNLFLSEPSQASESDNFMLTLDVVVKNAGHILMEAESRTNNIFYSIASKARATDGWVGNDATEALLVHSISSKKSPMIHCTVKSEAMLLFAVLKTETKMPCPASTLKFSESVLNIFFNRNVDD